MFRDATEGKIKTYDSLVLHFDGGCEPVNPGGVVTAGWALFVDEWATEPLVSAAKFIQDGGDNATNNVGEYSSLCLALEWLAEQGWSGELVVKADSKLVVEQVNGRWKCKAPHLQELLEKVWYYFDQMNMCLVTEDAREPIGGMNPLLVIWVPREHNSHADSLCRVAYEEYQSRSCK